MTTDPYGFANATRSELDVLLTSICLESYGVQYIRRKRPALCKAISIFIAKRGEKAYQRSLE